MSAAPSAGEVEQSPPTDKGTQPIDPPPPVVGTRRAQVEGDVLARRGNLHGPVLQPVEQATYGGVILRDVTVQRHRRVGDDLSHVVLLLPGVGRPSQWREGR